MAGVDWIQSGLENRNPRVSIMLEMAQGGNTLAWESILGVPPDMGYEGM